MTITQTLVGNGTNDTILFTATNETVALQTFFANTTAAAVSLTVHLSATSNAVANTATSNQIVTTYSIPAYDTWPAHLELGKIDLAPSNTIQAFASSSNAITATIITRDLP